MANESLAIPAELARNPHCEQRWPYSMEMNPRIALLLEASYGARTVAKLLLTDRSIADDLEAADDVHGHPIPFTANAVCGLHAALSICLHQIEVIAEGMQSEDERNARAGNRLT